MTRNIIRYNGSGLFLFETDRESNIHHNNFYDNLDNIRLGDFFTGEVTVNGNWWGAADPDAISETIYDSRVDPEIGTVHVMPAPKWVARTGPRDAAKLREAWRYETDGFVDASVLHVDGKLIVCSWDGTVTALNPAGQVLWTRALGDVVDATPARNGSILYVQSWGRELFAIDLTDGRDLWRFSFSPSPADDHRQGGIVTIGNLLLLPAWNGILYGLDADSGLRKWQYDAGLPLRSAPAVDEDRVYVASGSGMLSALGLEGELLWQYEFDAPLLSTPAVTKDGLVVVSRRGELVAFDRSGRVRWQKGLKEVCYYGGPYYHQGIIYLGTTAGFLWKIQAEDGKTVWRQGGLGPVYSTPQIDGKRIVVGDNDGNLSIVGIDSGTVIAQFRLDGDIQGTPLLLNGNYIVGGRDRNVYSLQPVDLAEMNNVVQ